MVSENEAIQVTFKEFLADLMDQKRIKTVSAFADLLGISRDTFYGWQRSSRKPDLESLVKLARMSGRPLHELVYLADPTAPGAGTIIDEGAVVRVPVKVAGWAGAGPDQLKATEAEVYVEESFAAGKNLMAFRIFGDSMQGGKRPIFDGDTVIVNQNDKSLEGFAVVARINDDGYVCKKPLLSAHGRLQQLVSTNLDYDDPAFRVIENERVAEVVGRVVRVIHDTP